MMPHERYTYISSRLIKEVEREATFAAGRRSRIRENLQLHLLRDSENVVGIGDFEDDQPGHIVAGDKNVNYVYPPATHPPVSEKLPPG